MAPTVFETLEDNLIDALEAVGRLDRDTEGLLLFSTDGQLIHRLTHPRHDVERTYLAKLENVPTNRAVARALAGELVLRDGHVPKPTTLRGVDDSALLTALGLDEGAWWQVTLTEGKYHEVRRLCAAMMAPVERLMRSQYASVTLQEPTGRWMTPGESRRLSEDETARLYDTVGLSPTRTWIELTHLETVHESESWAAEYRAQSKS